MTSKSDFPDWLSPMLVKELRQGVRTRVFVTVFILLQILLLVNTSLSLLVASVQQDATMGAVFFWLLVAVPVLIVLPAIALNSVGQEIKGNTLELIFLTRLTPLRIITGKWLAIFAQALLLVCTVLPYLVLRYFIGGVNVSSELQTLGAVLAGSALLCAAATGISGYPPRVVRLISGAAGIFVFLLLVSGLEGYFFRGASSTGPGLGAINLIAVLALGAILLAVMLEIGALRLAPPAENHSARLRLLAFAALAVAAAASLSKRDTVTVSWLAFCIGAGVSAIALCEEPRHIASIVRPFAARGLAGRAAGKLLYPGWPAGVLFTLAIFAGFGALLAAQGVFHKSETVLHFVAALGALLLPAALVRACLPRAKQTIPLYFAVHFFCILVSIFCAVCDNVLDSRLREYSSALPLCTLVMAFTGNDANPVGRLVLVTLTATASLVVLLVAMRRPLGQYRREETESLQRLAPPAHAPVA